MTVVSGPLGRDIKEEIVGDPDAQAGSETAAEVLKRVWTFNNMVFVQGDKKKLITFFRMLRKESFHFLAS